MLKEMKVSYLVIAAGVLFFSTSWIMGSSFGGIVQAQEPSTNETVPQEILFNVVDYAAPVTSETVNEADTIDPAAPIDTGAELTRWESLHLKPAADTADEAVLPAVPADSGAELTRWESLHLKSPADPVDYAVPVTSVKPGSELTMWERLNFLAPFLAD